MVLKLGPERNRVCLVFILVRGLVTGYPCQPASESLRGDEIDDDQRGPLVFLTSCLPKLGN